MAWLDRLTLWLQVALVCTFLIGVTWLGILAVHPVLRRLMHLLLKAGDRGGFSLLGQRCTPEPGQLAVEF
jgi:hypothetical protein